MKEFQLVSDFKSFEQRDIFCILQNLFSLDKKDKTEHDKLFRYLLNLTEVKENNTLHLIQQADEFKYNYELILLHEMSIPAQKYLNFILEYISINTENQRIQNKIKFLISELSYCNTIKDFIKDAVSKSLLYTESKCKSDLLEEISSASLKLINKEKSAFCVLKETIADTLSLSEDDGKYGIKVLSKGTNHTIHIFINGFTNDSLNNNFNEWIKQTKAILNQRDTFLGYDWASGKEISRELLSMPINADSKKILKFVSLVKGFNPYMITGALAVQVISEWKKAHYNSEKYSRELADFIEKKYVNNENIEINLYGHSLGANLIYNTLELLSIKSIQIKDVFLFGGASKNDNLSWKNVLSSVENIYNFYSYNDSILKFLYQSAELGDSPIGLNEINIRHDKIHNYNVSDIIEGHTEYIKKIYSIYYRIFLPSSN